MRKTGRLILVSLIALAVRVVPSAEATPLITAFDVDQAGVVHKGKGDLFIV